jgi:hypothetical protein
MTANPKLDIGDTHEFYICDQGFRVTVHEDSDAGLPWEREDGHGTVSGWTDRAKRPGELVLAQSRRSKRYYDFAEACRIARRDGWGVAPYHLDIDHGANDLYQARAQFFHGRQLVSVKSDWCDEQSDAIQQIYTQHKAMFPTARAYAAAAAFADYERLRRFCADDWGYVGIVVEMIDEESGDTEQSESLWGIESDTYSHIWDEAQNIAAGMIAPQCAP